MEFPVFQFMPIAFYPFIGHHRDKPGFFFTASHQIFIDTVKTVHVFLHVGYQPWAHLCYWLLILATVHITKTIIASKLFHGSGY